MQNDQFERRFNSIRSLPQGQFTKFRQMFDSDSKKIKQVRKNNERQINTSIEQFQIEMDRIFDGVSDETNRLLSSLCSKNRQIAEFFEQPKPDSTKDNFNEVSISSFLSDSSSSYSAESKKVVSPNIYSEISSESDNSDQKSASNVSFNSGLFKLGNKGNLTIQEPNDTVITYTIESDEMDTCFRSHSIDSSSLYSFPLNIASPKEDQIYSSNSFKHKNDAHISFISDDSSVDEYTEQANSVNNVLFDSPPPKPIRTFEYDIYLQTKNNNLHKISDTKTKDELNEHIYETLPFVRNTKLENYRKKVNNEIFNKINFFSDKGVSRIIIDKFDQIF